MNQQPKMFYLYHHKCSTCGHNQPLVNARAVVSACGANLSVRDVRFLPSWAEEADAIGGRMPFLYDYASNTYLELEDEVAVAQPYTYTDPQSGLSAPVEFELKPMSDERIKKFVLECM